MFGKLALALAATTMAAAPVAANPAQSLSVAKSVRASTASKDANGALGAGALGLVLGAGVIAILVLGLTVGDDDGLPDSN